jgi:hypothetical protein
VRPASPAALRLSVWAYAHLLRVYPASFRAEFGDEMALLFSDCCRDEWRSAGPVGVFRLLARVALDTLVSASHLWAERLEETMRGHSADRRWGFWLADHGLAMGGLALLAVGAATSWWAMSLGWAALAIAFFAWVAETEGLALPRPGRVAIRVCGCGESPLAFTVRRKDKVLFFVRQDDLDGEGWSDEYAVHDRPNGTGFQPCFELPVHSFGFPERVNRPSKFRIEYVSPTGEWSLRGRVPAADLRFEHHERVSYVTRRSLERSLSAAGV